MVGCEGLPGQALDEDVPLRGVQADGRITLRVRPHEATLVESTRGESDTQAIVDEHLDARRALVGEQMSVVRLRGTEHLDHASQRGPRCAHHDPHHLT